MPGRGWWTEESNAADSEQNTDDIWREFADHASAAVYEAVLGEVGAQYPAFGSVLEVWREHKADDNALQTLLVTSEMIGLKSQRLQELLKYEAPKEEGCDDYEYL